MCPTFDLHIDRPRPPTFISNSADFLPGTIARRISIHRATTVGPRFGLCQVIIKNTSAFKNVPHSASCTSINRSQSLLMTNRIPVLAPSRTERTRLETLLSDIWTRDVLPYPGMSSRARNEHPVRASASSMMRKLSVASITSNFTKRSGSMASLQRTLDDESLADIETPKPLLATFEDNSSEETPSSKLDDTSMLPSFLINGEKENAPKHFIDPHTNVTAGSPLGAVRRLATLKVKTIWAPDGQSIIIPPLRTSSANGSPHNRITSWSAGADSTTEKDDFSQSPQAIPTSGEMRVQRNYMWKGSGKRGIRNLFR